MFKLGTRWRWMVKITPRSLYFRQELWYPLIRRLFGTQSAFTSLILQVNFEVESVSPWRWKPIVPTTLLREGRILRIYCWYDKWSGKKWSPWIDFYCCNISPTLKRTWIFMELNEDQCSGITCRHYGSCKGQFSSWVPGRHLSYHGGIRSVESLSTIWNNFFLQ